MREFVGTLGVLLALTSMSPLPLPDLFEDGISTCEMPSTAEEPTRLTIRTEAASSSWRMRWASIVVAVAAAIAGVWQLDSRSSRVDHRARRPESKVVGGRRIVPHGGSRSIHDAGRRFAHHRGVRSATHSPLSPQRRRRRARAMIGQRPARMDEPGVSARAPESPVTPDVDDPGRPNKPNVGQFAYLGG